MSLITEFLALTETIVSGNRTTLSYDHSPALCQLSQSLHQISLLKTISCLLLFSTLIFIKHSTFAFYLFFIYLFVGEMKNFSFSSRRFDLFSGGTKNDSRQLFPHRKNEISASTFFITIFSLSNKNFTRFFNPPLISSTE